MGNNFVAVGRIRNKSEKSEKSGNERNRQGNYFVAAGLIRNKSEKAGNSQQHKLLGFSL